MVATTEGKGRYQERSSTDLNSVSDLDPVGSAFKLGLDLNPYLESGSGIQMSKNR